jgi:hypothetical protein
MKGFVFAVAIGAVMLAGASGALSRHGAPSGAPSLSGRERLQRDRDAVPAGPGVLDERDGPEHLPVVDFATAGEQSGDARQRALRAERGRRYDHGAEGPIREPKTGEDFGLGFTPRYLLDLAALPVERSDAIVVGRVARAEAFLSPDRTNVYSEYTIAVNDVLKSPPDRTGDEVVAERAGGAVRFASGAVRRYASRNQGAPRAGDDYVFFLRRNETGDDYTLLTAYKLRGGAVGPLDGRDDPDRFAFSRFAGASAAAFLETLTRAIAENKDFGRQGDPR